MGPPRRRQIEVKDEGGSLNTKTGPAFETKPMKPTIIPKTRAPSPAALVIRPPSSSYPVFAPQAPQKAAPWGKGAPHLRQKFWGT